MAAFSETGAFTSRWYEVEQVVLIPNLSETLEDFWSHSSVFALEKYSKSLSFKSIFTTKKTLVATFSETRGPISKEYVASQSIMMPKLLETLQCFWSHFSLFYFRKVLLKSKFFEYFCLYKNVWRLLFVGRVHSFLDNIELIHVKWCQVYYRHFKFFGWTPPFLL